MNQVSQVKVPTTPSKKVFSRPRLDDPVEFEIIRSIHLFDRTPLNEEIDGIDSSERLERVLSRQKLNTKSSR